MNKTDKRIKELEKELKETDRFANFSFILFLALILILFIFVMSIHSTMPTKVCHDEWETRKIEASCVFGGVTIPAGAIRICDEGVKGSIEDIDYDNIVWYCGDDPPKYCRYKTKKEVCEWE